MKRSKLQIAIIGCGAVTENVHLPALDKIGQRPALLVDTNLSRAEALATRFKVARFSEDYMAEWGKFDAAIVALPHHLHASVSMELLRHGVHVLVEKPMAMTLAECRDMIAAAKEVPSTLAVGLSRRFLPAANWVKAALSANVLGEIESFDFREGMVYNWPVASDFMFRKASGGGVLWDSGVHTLDLLLWWLGDVTDFTYRADSQGGVEADCEINMTLASGAKGFVVLSRLRKLRNTAIIKGSKGQIEVSLFGNRVWADPSDLLKFRAGNLIGTHLRVRDKDKISTLQLQDWLGAAATGNEPSMSGEQGAKSIALIEALSDRRQPLQHPWVSVPEFRAVAGGVRRSGC